MKIKCHSSMRRLGRNTLLALAGISVGCFATISQSQAQPPMGMGGPPMMFGGGGPPPWGGGDRGGRGDRGDRGEGGGRFGGGFGGFGGGGGFDPSQFLSNMDTNKNGSIDPEEAQGPARFMLDRMARNNPKIDLSKPIPLSTITEAFQQMRGGGDRGGWGGGSWGGSSDDDAAFVDNTVLVPGFGVKTEKAPIPGFGASAEKFNVRVEERDLRDADERIQRYDRNKDQSLDEAELKDGRWSDSPMQYDRNGDGKLSRQELAVRYARRRNASPEESNRDRDRERERSRNSYAEGEKGDKKDVPNPFEKITSYRLTDKEGNPKRPSGLPEWFTRNDANMDNQVTMNEFTRKWNAESIEDFERFDSNKDGFITAKECLAAVKKGYIPGAIGSGSSSSSSGSSSSGSSSGSTTAPSTASSSSASSGGSSDELAKMKDWMSKRLKSKDKDGNGFLDPTEYKDYDSRGDFNAVDTNKDGRLDIDELAIARLASMKK